MFPISPAIAKGPSTGELPAYLCNGVVGLRVRDNPLNAGTANVAGFSGLHPARKIEALAPAPYPLAADISINGVWLSEANDRLVILTQAYDFETAELTTRLRFTVRDVSAAIEVVTFCCRHQPTLVAQEIVIVPDGPCDLTVQSLVDTRAIHGKMLARCVGIPKGNSDEVDGSLCWESEGGLGRCGVAAATIFTPETEKKCPGGGDRSPLVSEYSLHARAGRPHRLQQIVSMVPSVTHNQPDRQAERLVALGRHYGFDRLRAANRAEWKELWKGRIVIEGAARRWQALADAAFFYMNTSAHVSSAASTSMFGQTRWYNYHYYYGHVMWDIETFCVPNLTVLQPDAAKTLLNFRSRHLDAALANARLFGRDGYQFPWESTPTGGYEAAPSPGTAAWHEDHVSLDIALAFVRYADATGDENFLKDQAWPVISGVCNWIASRAHHSRRGWEIRRSMGIAERKKECDNEAFTMLSAQCVLKAGLRIAKQTGRQPGPQWSDIADHLVLPIRDGMLVSHDGYRSNEEKGATPSPLMGLFPLNADLDASVVRRTLRFFLGRSRQYIGSPMLSSLYGVWAACGGDRAASLRLLEEGYGEFIAGRFSQTLEYRHDKFPEQPEAGPFLANIGGFLLSLLFGFPAIAIGPGPVEQWPQRDVVLPSGWKSIACERLWVRGRAARLLARQGRKATLSFSGTQD